MEVSSVSNIITQSQVTVKPGYQDRAERTPGAVAAERDKQHRLIRMVPELNIAALASHRDKELLFWYLLRTIDTKGRGYLPLAEAQQKFTSAFGFSKRTFYRHLRLGEAKLWSLDNNPHTTIKIYGIERVCRWFNTYKLSRWVFVSVEQLIKYPAKAFLWSIGAYRPFGTGRVNHPISRLSLQDVTILGRQAYGIEASPKAFRVLQESLESAGLLRHAFEIYRLQSEVR